MSSFCENEEVLIVSAASGRPSVLDFTQHELDKILHTQLSDDAMCALGEVDDRTDKENHTLHIKLRGKRALVYFVDQPSEYFIDRDSANSSCILRPALFRYGNPGPAIVIDPRSLSDPLSQLPSISILDKATFHGHAGGTSKGSDAGAGLRSGNSDSARSSSQQGAKPNKLPRFFSGGGGKGARGSYTSYNAGISDAVDGQMKLPQMPIGAIEFLTFFPHHTQWPAVMLRLFRNNWTTVEMAKAMLHARGHLTGCEYQRRKGALRHQLRTIVRSKYGVDTTGLMLRAQMHPHFKEFVDHMSGNNHDLYDVRLPVQTSGDLYQPPRKLNVRSTPALISHVIEGVTNFPTGQDEGQLTKAILWCQANGQTGQNTDFLAGVVRAHGLGLPSDALNKDWDGRAHERLIANVADPTT